MSAQSRASLAVSATSSLDATTLKDIIKRAAGEVKGGGASLLTTGIANLGAQVHIEKETADGLLLSITSGKRVVELCTFKARITGESDKTVLKLGGLDRYKTSQSTVLGFIPVGPKMVQGIAPYKRFLDAVADGIRAADGSARVTVAEMA